MGGVFVTCGPKRIWYTWMVGYAWIPFCTSFLTVRRWASSLYYKPVLFTPAPIFLFFPFLSSYGWWSRGPGVLESIFDLDPWIFLLKFFSFLFMSNWGDSIDWIPSEWFAENGKMRNVCPGQDEFWSFKGWQTLGQFGPRRKWIYKTYYYYHFIAPVHSRKEVFCLGGKAYQWKKLQWKKKWSYI